MTAKQAQNLTGLSVREYPEAKYEYLRCQLGEKELKTIQTSAFKSIPVPVFRIVVTASSWERAVELWEKKQNQT